jgi:hypothetical protein
MDYTFAGNKRLGFDFLSGLPTPTATLIGFVGLILISLAYFLWGKSRRWAALCLGLYSLSVVGISLTYSRAAFVGLAGALLLLFTVRGRKGWRLHLTTVFLTAVPLVAVKQGIDRFGAVYSWTHDVAVTRRFELWLGACNLGYAHFPSGVGSGKFTYEYFQWYQPLDNGYLYSTPVSLWLTIFAEKGPLILFTIIVLCLVVGQLLLFAVGHLNHWVPLAGLLLGFFFGTVNCFCSVGQLEMEAIALSLVLLSAIYSVYRARTVAWQGLNSSVWARAAVAGVVGVSALLLVGLYGIRASGIKTPFFIPQNEESEIAVLGKPDSKGILFIFATACSDEDRARALRLARLATECNFKAVVIGGQKTSSLPQLLKRHIETENLPGATIVYAVVEGENFEYVVQNSKSLPGSDGLILLSPAGWIPSVGSMLSSTHIAYVSKSADSIESRLITDYLATLGVHVDRLNIPNLDSGEFVQWMRSWLGLLGPK